MSHEQINSQQSESTHAFDGPDLQSSAGGVSMPPPPFQLQVSPGGAAGAAAGGAGAGAGAAGAGGGARTSRGPSPTGGESPSGPAALISDDLLVRIYTAASDREQAQTFVRSLNDAEINEAYSGTQETMRTEEEEHAANPMDEFDSGSHQYQNVEWDMEGFEEDSENDWGASNISPRDTGTDPATLREAFETHRLLELKRLVDADVTMPQVMAAQRLAGAHSSPLAEGVRRLIFMANEYAVVQTLNPEQSERYRPGRLRGRGSQTYCNTYVHDVLRAMGVAERAIPGGSANNLSNAMHRRGMRDFWTEITGGAEAAQQRADAGCLVIITAHGNQRARRETDEGDGPFYTPGHISLVLPQNEALDAHAGRAEDGTFSPLESNAGGGSQWVGEGEDRRPSANWRFQNRADLYQGNPEVYLTNRRGQQVNRSVDWWNSGHHDGAFWEYTGALNNPEALNSPEAMGLAVNAGE